MPKNRHKRRLTAVAGRWLGWAGYQVRALLLSPFEFQSSNYTSNPTNGLQRLRNIDMMFRVQDS